MKLIILCLCLMGTTCANPLRKRRKAGFGSKSEEMMSFGAYGMLNSPQFAASLYGYRPSFLQMFPQQSMTPLQRPFLWQQQMPGYEAARLSPQKPQQPPAAKRPNGRQQPRHQVLQQQPKVLQPPKQPPRVSSLPQPQPQPPVPVQQPKAGKQQHPQAFLPHQQHPWHFPQMFGNGGFHPQPFGPYQGRTPRGRPHVSNEEGMPYFGYGYHGMGGRAPYSEEMFEQDFEEPVEKEPPKETPVTNSTVPDTNTTVSNPANQGGNATISGPSVTGTAVNSLGLQSKLVDGNEISTPSPTHVSGGNRAAQEALEPSGHQPKSPNINIIQSFPPASQLSAGHVAHIYNSRSEMGDARYNTLTSRGNPPIQNENKLHSFDYRENADPRDNFQSTNNNQALENPRPVSYRHQEQSHFIGRSPSGQGERKHFPTSDPLSEWNKDPVYGENYQNNSPPEGTSLDQPIDRLGQHSGMQQSNPHSQQEIFSATRRTPFETEIHHYDWKQQMSSRPDHEREQFPPAQNQMRNNRENSWVFQDKTPPRYKTMYSLDSTQQRGQAVYSYQQNGRPISSGTWEERKDSPIISSANQRKSLSYSPSMPSNQKQNTYYRSVQEENEPPPNQNPWTHENNLLDFDRRYKNLPYDPAQHQMYSRYSTEAAANERHNLPYEKINQWAQEKHILVPSTEHLKQVENIPYDTNGMFGQKDQNMMKQGSDSPPQGTTLSQRGAQYAERNPWVSPILDPFPRKETLPYFNTHSTDFRRKSDDDTDDVSKITQGSAPISGVNVAGRKYNPNTLRYSEDYPREHRTTHPHSTANHLCCVGDSPVMKEGLPAPLRSAPQFRLALWGQTESSAYPEGSHGKHARHAPFPAGIQSSQTLLMGKNQKESLGTFIEEVTGLQKKLPCSKLSQDDLHETNCDTGLPALKSTHNYGNNLRGDRHSIPVQMMEERESRWELGQADLKLVPETFPGLQRIRSETLGNEDGRKEQHAAIEVKRIPCFASWLKHYLSSTGAPSGDQKHNLFHGETPSPTSRPNNRPPESKPIASTNPSYDNVEEKHLTFGSPGEEWVEQPNETTPDCLLLQNK